MPTGNAPDLPPETPVVLYRRRGGPEVLELADMSLPRPAPGEVLLRHSAIGVNFSDVNARRGGFYSNDGPLPAIPGNEAVGVVAALGDGVTDFQPGERAAYAGMGGAFFQRTGAYAAWRVVPASRLLRLPDGLDEVTVAAVLVKGLTASACFNRFHRPAPGETVLIHAAASGVGLILCQWAKHLGARVLGTVGSGAKAQIALAHGCDEAIPYRDIDFAAMVRTLCPDGVTAVYDGVGRDTLLSSLDCLRPFGKLINYGNASGPAPAVDPTLLSAKGSLQLARLALGDHIRAPEDYRTAAAELFDLCRAGAIRPHLRAVLPLTQATAAHRMLESGQGAGAIVLLPAPPEIS